MDRNSIDHEGGWQGLPYGAPPRHPFCTIAYSYEPANWASIKQFYSISHNEDCAVERQEGDGCLTEKEEDLTERIDFESPC